MQIGVIFVTIAFIVVVLLLLGVLLNTYFLALQVPQITVKGYGYCIYADNNTYNCTTVGILNEIKGIPTAYLFSTLVVNGKELNVTNITTYTSPALKPSEPVIFTTKFTANATTAFRPGKEAVQYYFLDSGFAFIIIKPPQNDVLYLVTGLLKPGLDNRTLNTARYILTKLYLENMTYFVYQVTTTGTTLLAEGVAYGTTSQTLSLTTISTSPSNPFIVFVDPYFGVKPWSVAFQNTTLYWYKFNLPPIAVTRDEVLADYLILYNATATYLQASPTDFTSLVLRVAVMKDGNLLIQYIGGRTDNLVMAIANPPVPVSSLLSYYVANSYTLPTYVPYAIVEPWGTRSGVLGNYPIWNPVTETWNYGISTVKIDSVFMEKILELSK